MIEIDENRGPYITTLSNSQFFIEECNVADIPIIDVAHSLSMKCRFNGHLNHFYSVAEHSVFVSRLVPEEDALWGLLHDASEAFLPDVPRPFKGLFPGFKEYEDRILQAFAEVYDLPWPVPESVKEVDKHIIAAEAQLFYPNPPEWVKNYEPMKIPYRHRVGTPWLGARRLFMDTLEDIIYA